LVAKLVSKIGRKFGRYGLTTNSLATDLKWLLNQSLIDLVTDFHQNQFLNRSLNLFLSLLPLAAAELAFFVIFLFIN
jgi:hypothetical protein